MLTCAGGTTSSSSVLPLRRLRNTANTAASKQASAMAPTVNPTANGSGPPAAGDSSPTRGSRAVALESAATVTLAALVVVSLAQLGQHMAPEVSAVNPLLHTVGPLDALPST